MKLLCNHIVYFTYINWLSIANSLNKKIARCLAFFVVLKCFQQAMIRVICAKA